VALHQVVVIGSSAGGLDPLLTILRGLSKSLNACVLVDTHTATEGTGMLPQILRRVSVLPVDFASDRTPLPSGRISVPKPDFHLLVDDSHLRVVHGPRGDHPEPAAGGTCQRVSEGAPLT